MWTEFLNQKIIFDILIAFAAGFCAGYGIRLLKKRKERAKEKSIEGYVKGISYIIDDETDKAIEELVKVAQTQSDLIDVYISIGSLFRKRGEINRALIVHKSLLARPHLSNEKKSDIFINLGIDYKKAGFYSRAEEAFKKALELNPRDKQAHRFLEEVYEDNKDWESATRWQKRFETKDNIVAHLYTEWGKKLFADGDLDKAQEKFKKAYDSDDECVDSCLWLGKTYKAKGRERKAHEIWKIYHPHYVVVMDPALVNIVDVTEGIRENGWVLINTSKTPKDFSFHTNVAAIDAFSIATGKKLGSHGHPIVNTTILGALVKIATVVKIKTLVEAIRESISSNTEKNVEAALAAYDKVKI